MTADHAPMTPAGFFRDHPEEQRLFEAVKERILRKIPQSRILIQKSQIAFQGGGDPPGRAYCWIWLPIRKGIKNRPEHYLVLTIPAPERINSARIVEAVEPAPGRWTHHLIIASAMELDEEILEWLIQADHWRNPVPDQPTSTAGHSTRKGSDI